MKANQTRHLNDYTKKVKEEMKDKKLEDIEKNKMATVSPFL